MKPAHHHMANRQLSASDDGMNSADLEGVNGNIGSQYTAVQHRLDLTSTESIRDIINRELSSNKPGCVFFDLVRFNSCPLPVPYPLVQGLNPEVVPLPPAVLEPNENPYWGPTSIYQYPNGVLSLLKESMQIILHERFGVPPLTISYTNVSARMGGSLKRGTFTFHVAPDVIVSWIADHHLSGIGSTWKGSSAEVKKLFGETQENQEGGAIGGKGGESQQDYNKDDDVFSFTLTFKINTVYDADAAERFFNHQIPIIMEAIEWLPTTDDCDSAATTHTEESNEGISDLQSEDGSIDPPKFTEFTRIGLPLGAGAITRRRAPSVSRLSTRSVSLPPDSAGRVHHGHPGDSMASSHDVRTPSMHFPPHNTKAYSSNNKSTRHQQPHVSGKNPKKTNNTAGRGVGSGVLPDDAPAVARDDVPDDTTTHDGSESPKRDSAAFAPLGPKSSALVFEASQQLEEENIIPRRQGIKSLQHHQPQQQQQQQQQSKFTCDSETVHVIPPQQRHTTTTTAARVDTAINKHPAKHNDKIRGGVPVSAVTASGKPRRQLRRRSPSPTRCLLGEEEAVVQTQSTAATVDYQVKHDVHGHLPQRQKKERNDVDVAVVPDTGNHRDRPTEKQVKQKDLHHQERGQNERQTAPPQMGQADNAARLKDKNSRGGGQQAVQNKSRRQAAAADDDDDDCCQDRRDRPTTTTTIGWMRPSQGGEKDDAALAKTGHKKSVDARPARRSNVVVLHGATGPNRPTTSTDKTARKVPTPMKPLDDLFEEEFGDFTLGDVLGLGNKQEQQPPTATSRSNVQTGVGHQPDGATRVGVKAATLPTVKAATLPTVGEQEEDRCNATGSKKKGDRARKRTRDNEPPVVSTHVVDDTKAPKVSSKRGSKRRQAVKSPEPAKRNGPDDCVPPEPSQFVDDDVVAEPLTEIEPQKATTTTTTMNHSSAVAAEQKGLLSVAPALPLKGGNHEQGVTTTAEKATVPRPPRQRARKAPKEDTVKKQRRSKHNAAVVEGEANVGRVPTTGPPLATRPPPPPVLPPKTPTLQSTIATNKDHAISPCIDTALYRRTTAALATPKISLNNGKGSVIPAPASSSQAVFDTHLRDRFETMCAKVRRGVNGTAAVNTAEVENELQQEIAGVVQSLQQEQVRREEKERQKQALERKAQEQDSDVTGKTMRCFKRAMGVLLDDVTRRRQQEREFGANRIARLRETLKTMNEVFQKANEAICKELDEALQATHEHVYGAAALDGVLSEHSGVGAAAGETERPTRHGLTNDVGSAWEKDDVRAFKTVLRATQSKLASTSAT